MRRLGVTMVLGGIALALFLYVQPLLTIRVLAGALKDSDTEAIRERMDAESVRRSLREVYLARLGRAVDDADRSAAVVASLVLFGRGIEMLMATTSDEDEARSARLARWHFESTSLFRATLEQGTNPQITVILERRGASWQVVAMAPSEAAWQQLDRRGRRDMQPPK